ncbi:amidohydrolase family protein [Sphingopyxis sp. 2PD]|uniref:N-acyl-D-amino-acid deacylase family protein n=1 Tax=Sphingopyxis sp. 2PD TaxID=2502196 RepID=UPI0010F97DBC|nr:amidohydrolase family protein [Sphingopyxis sp. 2PD]
MPSTASFPVRRAIGALVAGAALVAVTGATARTDKAVDVIIRGGTIYDGSPDKPVVGDVAIRGDRIVAVGRIGNITARRVIDAKGMIVAPGFIDPHTHADSFLRSSDPKLRVNAAWLHQGVTTVMIGVDGNGTPDVAADSGKLAASGIGTNIVPFVGFGPVRQRVLGQNARAPSATELDAMKALVANGMCEGAVGLSAGLFYAPQSFATTDEVVAVAREAAIRGGLYDTHQRDESSYSIGLIGSVEEAIAIGRRAGMPVHFAHLKALGVDVHGQAGAVIAAIEAARKAGVEVTADQYPWLASGSNLDASLLPRWAVDGGGAALLKRLDDPATLARLRDEMQENLRRRGGPGALLLIAEGFPWTGKTVAAVADEWKMDSRDAALRIIRQSIEAKIGGQKGGGTAVASFNMAQADVDLLMQQPWMVTSSDGSDGHPRMFATFPEKYARYVRERRVIDVATFIRQSTGRTADIYKLDRRGYLRPGFFADIVVLDPAGYAPRADYVRPRELSVGVQSLFVNGALALDDGRTTGVAAGRALLRPRPPGCPG